MYFRRTTEIAYKSLEILGHCRAFLSFFLSLSHSFSLSSPLPAPPVPSPLLSSPFLFIVNLAFLKLLSELQQLKGWSAQTIQVSHLCDANLLLIQIGFSLLGTFVNRVKCVSWCYQLLQRQENRTVAAWGCPLLLSHQPQCQRHFATITFLQLQGIMALTFGDNTQ